MQKSSFVLALLLTTPVAIAQNCFAGPAAGTLLGNLVDTIYPAQAIGFAFPLAGSTYTDIHISDHGLAFLSNAGVPTPPAGGAFVYTPSLANFGIGNPIIAAMWSDTVGGGINSGVYIDSSASSCRIEWRNVNSFGFATQFNLAMTLFPNGNIQFDYDPSVTNASTFGGVSDNGIVGVTTGGALTTPVDLSAGGANANNIVFENWVTANTFDMQNNSLLMIQTNPGWSYVLLGPSSNCANAVDYGTGCGGGGIDSIYESYTSTSFDLVGSSISWIRGADNYTVINLPGTFVPPTPAAQAVAAGLLDGQQQFTLSSAMPIPGGTTTVLNITTKGQVELNGTPGVIDFLPSAAKLLDWPNAAFHCWHDFYQGPTAPGAGAILFEEIGGVAYATWNAVASFSSTQTSTVQWQFNLASGNATLVVVSAGGIGDLVNLDFTVVGYSVGGVSADPGSTDLSAIPGAVLVTDFILPLALTTNGSPTIGSATFGYELTNVPALVPVAFLFFGDTQLNPGIPLDSIGMAGCTAWTNANLGSVAVPVVGGTGLFTLPIPASPSLAGTTFSTMGVAFSLATALNLVSSNGNLATVGN